VLPIPVAPPRPGPWLPPSLDDANTDPDSYDEAILSVDEQVARLVAALEPLGMRERTVVVLTADHGEALGVEDDGSSLHGHALYEELAHVPLVVLLPWLAGERRIPEVVSLVDLAPTLVDLAGLPVPASFAGASLFASRSTIDPPAALLERFDAPWALGNVVGAGSVVEWAMREGSWKLLLERHRARLYDLADDPKETIDVKESHSDVAGYLAGRISRLSPALSEHDQPPIGDAAGEIAPSLTEALKALGYLSE
jgi:arylsulfatase A-like enzyme